MFKVVRKDKKSGYCAFTGSYKACCTILANLGNDWKIIFC